MVTSLSGGPTCSISSFNADLALGARRAFGRSAFAHKEIRALATAGILILGEGARVIYVTEAQPVPALVAVGIKRTSGQAQGFSRMAPGVGKTYEMLRQARRRKMDVLPQRCRESPSCRLSTNTLTPMPRVAASETLAGCRGTAGGVDRCLDDQTAARGSVRTL